MIPVSAGLLQLYVVRHGETTWTLSGQHTGCSEIPLTREGEMQACNLRPALAGIRFAAVLCSPRRRARHTCELAGLGAAAQTEEDLSEWDYGVFEGLQTREIQRRQPGWNLYRDGCPGGESPGQVTLRVDRLIAGLLARRHDLGGNVALFTHAQLAAVLAARWIGLAAAEGQHFPLGPATLSVLGHQPAHPEVPVIGLWNAVPGLPRPWPPQAPVTRD